MSSDNPESEKSEPARFDTPTRGIMPNEEVTHLHLLRHAEVEQMDERVVRGQLDVNLSQRGEAQTRALAEWFAREVPKPDVIWTSDLLRCRVLADALVKRTGSELQVDARLREQDMGDWQGKGWSAITAKDGAAVTAYWDDYVNARPTGGESYRELHERVTGWWDEKKSALADASVVVVTHVGVVRSFQCQLLGIAPSEALRFAPAVASHSAFLISEAGAVQTSFGERPWTFGGAK